jgi:predicted RNase H-like HicB family nuclease
MIQHRYHINLFWSAEDSCWIADVPDLRSCSAHGDTPSEAIAEAEVAIELWLETARECGLPNPEARYRPEACAAR